ncbi:MAG: hypothetical protein WDM89_18525 [Rhizomicrobium sp.]
MQQAAEIIYERTQPYRYAVYEDETQSANGGLEKARAILEELVESGVAQRTRLGPCGLASLADTMDPRQAMIEQEKSLALDPSFALAWNNLAGSDPLLGHDEESGRRSQSRHRPVRSGQGRDERGARRASCCCTTRRR